MAEKGIRVFHSNRLLNGTSPSERYLRIALSSAHSLDKLDAGLRTLKKFFG